MTRFARTVLFLTLITVTAGPGAWANPCLRLLGRVVGTLTSRPQAPPEDGSGVGRIERLESDPHDDFVTVFREGRPMEYIRTNRDVSVSREDGLPADFLIFAAGQARVLDLGAGRGAALVRDLRSQGVDAHGLDLRFDHFGQK